MRRKLRAMKFLALAWLGLLVSTACAQAARPLLAAQIPLRAPAPQGFVPRGWTVEHLVLGDLNGDGRDDDALVLVENKPARDEESLVTARQRALVVVLHEKSGWRRVGFNSTILLGTRDGGAWYNPFETPVHVLIEGGFLLVNEDGGSRKVIETTRKFRFDERTKRVYLVASLVSERDALTDDGRSESTDYLTGVRDIILIRGEDERATHQIRRVSRKLRVLESVRDDERSGNA